MKRNENLGKIYKESVLKIFSTMQNYHNNLGKCIKNYARNERKIKSKMMINVPKYE